MLSRLNSSVRGRLVCLVLAIALPASALVGLLVWQAYRNQRGTVTQDLLATTRVLAAMVDNEMADLEALLQSLAAGRELRGDDVAAFEARLRRAERGGERWFVLAEMDGQQLIDTRRPTGDPLPRHPLPEEQRAAVEQGRTYFSDVMHSPAVAPPVLSISVPVVVPGEPRRVLSGGWQPGAFARELPVDRFAAGLVVCVLDRTGRIALHSVDGERFVGELAPPELRRDLRERPEGWRHVTTLEGWESIVVHSRAPRTGWNVAIGAPLRELDRPARRLLFAGMTATVLLMGIAGWMAVWIGRAVVRSVDNLVADTHALGRGERPPERSGALEEIDFVAQAMRETARRLGEREQENARLTRALQTDLEREKRAEERQAALFALAAAVNRAGELPEILEAAISAILRCRGADRAAILLPDAARAGAMRCRAVHGVAGAFCRAIEEMVPWAGDEVSPPPRQIGAAAGANPELRRAMVAEGVAVLVCVPLLVQRRLGGMFVLCHDGPREISADALQPMQTIASQVAFALERQRHAEALESLVQERTASLRDAVAQMEEFSYSVSHDLRAPARAMRAYAEVILEDHGQALDPTGRELLGRIQRNSLRMDRLIQDLLTYTRISRREVRLEPVAVEKLIAEVVLQYPELGAERADIVVCGPIASVQAHEPSLSQVVSNLLSNAVKFVPPGRRPRVEIRSVEAAGRVCVEVRDNGIGIAPEAQRRLFRMFERVHRGHYEGTGIGLAIVRRALERMNGTVGVESDGKGGSVFWFELPPAHA